MDELQKLMDEISEWSNATFGDGQRNPSILYHLKKEVPELIEAIENYQNNKASELVSKQSTDYLREVVFEYADCMILLLDSAAKFGLTAEMLIRYVNEKREINKKRKWGKPDSSGVCEHIREA